MSSTIPLKPVANEAEAPSGKEREFDVGDIVRLNSESEEMCVEAIVNGRVSVAWLNESLDLCSATLSSRMFSIVHKRRIAPT